jgi:D-alanyl-D-alanine carboxypeptidase
MKRKSQYIVLIVILSFTVSTSCKKDLDFLDVSDECQINFSDSSSQNPKAQDYQKLLDKYVQKGLPGLVLLVKTQEQGLWVGASGYSNIETKSKMKKCNIVYSASIGKTFCAVAVMQLVDQGKIQLEDKINLYLGSDICDKIPNGNSATIRDLLGHTSGIPNFETGTNFIADVLNDPFSITTQDLLEYEYNKKPLFSVGEGYKYSSTGYELLAKIIDNVTGENHSNFYTSNIFVPIGLENTFYKQQAGFPTPPGLVQCYFDRLGNGKIENVSATNNYLTKIFTGSDGIMASVYDYYLFINALVNGNLVSGESFNEMTNWRDTYSWTTNQYGLGLQKRDTKYGIKIGHDGDAMGAGADMFYFPESDVFIVLATNLGTFLETDLTELYNSDFQDELLDIVFKK